MSIWSKLFGNDIDSSGADTPDHEQTNPERPTYDPAEAALDSIRHHGLNMDDMETILGPDNNYGGGNWFERMINAAGKWVDDHPDCFDKDGHYIGPE